MMSVRLLVAVQLVILSMECVSNAESPNQIPIQITTTGVSTTHGYEKPTTHDRLTENMVNRMNDLEVKVLKMEDLLTRALDTIDRMSRGEDEHNRAISEMKEKIERSCSCEGAPWLNKTDDGMEDWIMKLSEQEIREIMPNITDSTPDPSSRDRDMMKLRMIENMLNVTAEAMSSEKLERRSILRRFRREPMAMEESILKETAMDLTMMSKKCSFSASRTQTLLGEKDKLQRVTFHKQHVMKGEGFNAETGVFVTPIPGIYYFSFTVRTYDHKYIGLSLMLNEEPVISMMTDPSNRKVMQTQSAMLHLKRGDTVWLMLGANEDFALYGNIMNNYTTFNGHLIYPDHVM